METKVDEEKALSSHSTLPDETDQQVIVDATVTDPNANIIDWNGPNDPEIPVNWSTSKKVINLIFVSIFTFLTYVFSSLLVDL